MLHFLHWCYTWTALLSANQNRVMFSCILLSKWVKWNISVEHEVVFPRLNFLWGDWITLRCFFCCLFVFFVFSFAIYFSSSLHILWDVCLWNYMLGIIRGGIFISIYNFTSQKRASFGNQSILNFRVMEVRGDDWVC